jgi:hypothetical protein
MKTYLNNDEKNQLDANSVIYSHKLTLHVSSIYVLFFRITGCDLLRLVFRTVGLKLKHSAQDCKPAPRGLQQPTLCGIPNAVNYSLYS